MISIHTPTPNVSGGEMPKGNGMKKGNIWQMITRK
jgi:hypothetical protein